MNDIGIGRRNSQSTRNTRIVCQANASISRAVDYCVGRARLKLSDSGDLPTVEEKFQQLGAAFVGCWSGSRWLLRRRV